MKKIISIILPVSFLKFYLSIKLFISDYAFISRLAQLNRKIIKNIELEDDEYQNLKEFLVNIPNENKIYVDIGAADGVNASTTLQLAKKDDWSGYVFDFGSISELSYLYRSFKHINIGKTKVTPNNVNKLLNGFEVNKNFGFLNLDIDSYDFEVIKSILEGGFSPFVISMEINEKIPPPIKFYVKYKDNFKLSGNHFYGCSISSAFDLLNDHNFLLKHLNKNNALFLNRKYFNLEGQDAETAYKDGYVRLKNRKEVFYYNKDMDELLNLEKADAINFINHKFQNYKDNYFIE